MAKFEKLSIQGTFPSIRSTPLVAGLIIMPTFLGGLMKYGVLI